MTTRQQQYDQQALDALRSRFPEGASVAGSVVTLPVPSGTPISRRAVGSIRVSKGRDEMISPEIQWDSVWNYARSRDLVLCKVFLDMHKTGRIFEKRAVVQIVEEVKRKEYSSVVLWKWSRWGRNATISGVYVNEVEAAGGKVYAATEDIDTSTAIGKFQRGFMFQLAELESDQKSEQWRETHGQRRKNGLPHTSGPRYGYTYSRPSGYTIDQTLAPVVRDLYTRFVQGEKMISLTDWMNSRGLFTTTGNRWTPTALGRMLDTGFAAGLIRERSNPPKARENKKKLKDFDIWREGTHEPIIDRELWEAYYAIRVANASKPRRVLAATHTFTGVLLCGECGSGMHSVYSSANRKHTWTCTARQRDKSKSLPVHAPVTCSDRRILAAVEAWIGEHREGGEDMDLRVAQAAAGAPSIPTNLENLQNRVDSLKAERLTLSKQLMKGRIAEEDFDQLKAELDAELEGAEIALASAARAEPRREVPTQAAWDSLSSLWGQATSEQRRRLLTPVASGVVIKSGPWSDSKVLVVPAWL